MPLKSTEGENLLICRTNVLTKNANFKKITQISMFLDRIWYFLSVFLQNQENISVLVEILTKKSQYFWLCDLGSVFGFALRRFPRKVFTFLQFWALEGSIHLLLSAISFLITTNFATEQYGHPYYYLNVIESISAWNFSGYFTTYWDESLKKWIKIKIWLNFPVNFLKLKFLSIFLFKSRTELNFLDTKSFHLTSTNWYSWQISCDTAVTFL